MSGRGGYYDHHWRRARDAYLRIHPMCIMCRARGRVIQANVVDHIKPHNGNMTLFWDQDNWQALCKHCHDAYKRALDKSGHLIGASTSGMPLDPNHHWNRTTTTSAEIGSPPPPPDP